MIKNTPNPLRNKADTAQYAKSASLSPIQAVAVAAPATGVPVGSAAGDGSTMLSQPSLPFLAWNIQLPPSLRALGHRNFRLFFTGQLISLIGTWMQAVARGWLVLELTHSAAWLGLVGFANSIPVLLLSLSAGEMADKFSKRTLIIWTQTLSMITALVLAFLALTGLVEVWHVFVLSLIAGAIFAFDAPARQAFTVEMTSKDDLINAVALNSSIFNGARAVGPAIGAVVLALTNPGVAFLLNGLSYLAVIAGLFMMRLPKHVHKPSTGDSWKRIVEGLSYVRNDKIIGPLMLLLVTVSIFAFPYSVLMPVFAEDVLHVGDSGYGVLMALSGVGALIGALSLTVQSGKKFTGRGRIILMGSIGLPAALGIFALSGNYILSLVMLVGVGWTMISINATVNTVIQTSVPDELRGRVMGVFAFLFVGMAPAGNLQAGLIADHFGAPAALFFGAMVCGVVILWLFLKHREVFRIS